jgi:hypothetical protein
MNPEFISSCGGHSTTTTELPAPRDNPLPECSPPTLTSIQFLPILSIDEI